MIEIKISFQQSTATSRDDTLAIKVDLLTNNFIRLIFLSAMHEPSHIPR